MKKNKKGFVLIETIVTVVVLTTSLLYLYNSYSSIIANENTRLYYDDVAYIYKANYIRTSKICRRICQWEEAEWKI